MVCKKCRKDNQPLCLCGFCKDCIQKYGHDNLGRESYDKKIEDKTK
jgi:hypothetical protein